MAAPSLGGSRAFLRAALDAALDAIVGMDHEGRIIEFSRAAEEIFGHPREKVLGESLAELIIPPSLRERHRGALLHYLETRAPSILGKRLELTAMRSDGAEFPVELTVTRLERDDPPRFVAFIRDLSERRRAEEEQRRLEEKMRQAQKLESLGLLSGGIAHDFNNLLTGILGHASLALMELPPAAPVRENLHRIEAASRRAADLCDQMLAYSGRGGFVIEPISLNDVVKEMVPLLTASISKKARFQTDLAEGLALIRGDVTQIRQVVMNLITNASDAIGDQLGSIHVATGAERCNRRYLDEISLQDELPEGDYVCVEVTDTGCGMDEATRSRIFDPFFTTKFTGRGLGLAAVLGILRGHDGAVEVHSEPGRGTRIKVLLPVYDGVVEAPQKQPDRPKRASGQERILLVDDEATVRVVATNMLEEAGFTVRTATTGDEAIELFRGQPDEIACVVLDLTMPERDGLETLEALRRIRSDVRVILSSGYSEREAASRLLGQGPAGFLKKPYGSSELVDLLRTVLGEPGPG